MKKILSLLICALVVLNVTACDKTESLQSEITTAKTASASETELTKQTAPEKADSTGKSADEIVQGLSLEEKAAQMTMITVYSQDAYQMEKYGFGSVLSSMSETTTAEQWRQIVAGFQEQALSSSGGIPFVYGQDDVHGVNYCFGAVIFPHNIGIGAANDPELTYQMGLAVADEAKLCNMLWNYSPCVAQAVDPRWGRTYESYSSELDIIKSLSVSYVKGLNDGGILATAKHFFGDGNAVYGTGEDSDVDRIIDRGDAALSDEEINGLLSVYQELVDAGVGSVMVNHGSVNGVKMHENGKYISYLKNEMGFDGFVCCDWNSIDNISGSSRKEKVIKSVNAGVDMLMQVDSAKECMGYIVDGVNEGSIPAERVDDAAKCIIQAKINLGLFDDPMLENLETKQSETGSAEYRALAEKLVEKSLVLAKNDNNILPLKSGTKVYVTGRAADNIRAQCGGWTLSWRGSDNVSGGTTILSGLKEVGAEQGIEIITDKARADEADVVLLCIGEQAYAEWEGDTEDLSITGRLALGGNLDYINEAKALGKPTVACIVAGRQVIVKEYADSWDSVVMCYLPGTEGRGIANVLMGKANFSGKLPMPWYGDISEIGTDEAWLDVGFGLSYSE